MKLVRPLLIVLGVGVALIAAGVALVLIPAIQKRIVLRLAAGQPGLQFDVGRVAAGFSCVALADVQVEQQGFKVKIGRLEIDYSAWPLLFSHTLSVRHLTATGLVVDTTQLARKKTAVVAAAAPVAAPGRLTDVKLPFELVLDDCDVMGRALVKGAVSQPPLEVDFEIKGGNFSPGREGMLRLTATVKNPTANADVGTLHAQVDLGATQTVQRSFSHVNITAVVNAVGPALSERNQLKIITELTKGAGGESYALSIDTLIRDTTENLLALHTTLPLGQNEYSGEWTLKARHAQLEPFFLGWPLPDFDVRGEGRLTYAPVTRATGLKGNLDVEVSRLEVINPVLKAVGPVKLQAQFDVTAAGPVARLQQLNIKLNGEKPVLELLASQAAEVNFKERRFRVGGVGAAEGLNLKLHGVPLTWIAQFMPDIQVSGGTITGEFSIAGDADSLLLRGIHPLHIDQLNLTQQGTPLLSNAAVSLALEATLTDSELRAKIGEFTLQTPAGDAFSGQAAILIPVTTHPTVSIQAGYSAEMPTLLTPWLPKAHLKATGSTDFVWSEGKIDLRALTTDLTDANGASLFKATTLRPFIFDLTTGRATGEKSTVELAQIGLGRIPLEWVPLKQPGVALGGMTEPCEFMLRREGGKLSLRPVTALKLAGISVVQDDAPVLSGVTVEMSPAFEMDGGMTTVQTGDMTVRNSAGAAMMTLKGEAVRSSDRMRVMAGFNLEIPVLASQPVFAGAKKVSAGRASGEIRATLSATAQVEARLTVNGLVERDNGQLLPVANLSLRAVVQGDGKTSLQAPVLLDRAGQRSDLNFSLELIPSGPAFTLDGKLTGEHLELADAAAVLGVFSTSAAHASSVEKSPESVLRKIAPDKAAAWSRLTGRLLLDVKSASAGKDWSMTGLTGLVAIEPAVISLKTLEASFSGKSRLTVKAEIKFEAGVQPYHLAGDFSLTEFDAGKLFKALEPAKPPSVEGLFDVAGHFTGGGETVESTVGRTHGQFDLTSRQGVFRGLQRTTNKVSATSRAVEMGASVLGSLFGSEKVTKAAEKVAGQAYFVDQLAQNLSEFNYDQLNVRLVRDESLNLTMEEIGLLSPEIRLLGKGSVTYVQGKSLLEQPMNVTLSLAARGKVEQLLGKLHLTDGTRDEVGYAKTKEPVTIGGSLAKPDPTAFFTRIGTAKISDLLDTD